MVLKETTNQNFQLKKQFWKFVLASLFCVVLKARLHDASWYNNCQGQLFNNNQFISETYNNCHTSRWQTILLIVYCIICEIKVMTI